MKKYITLTIVAMSATISQAVSIDWAVGGKLYLVDPDADPVKVEQAYAGTAWSSLLPNNAYFVLVYLGNNVSGITASGLDLGAGGKHQVVDTAGFSDLVMQSGSAAVKGNANLLQQYAGADVAGDTYQVFFYIDGAYYDVYSSSSLGTPFSSVSVVGKDAQDVYSANPLYASGGSTTAAYVRVVIPEPATAAMALAGLALLFRRKRK